MEFRRRYPYFEALITAKHHTPTRDGGRWDGRNSKDLPRGLGGPFILAIIQKRQSTWKSFLLG